MSHNSYYYLFIIIIIIIIIVSCIAFEVQLYDGEKEKIFYIPVLFDVPNDVTAVVKLATSKIKPREVRRLLYPIRHGNR